MVVSMAASAIDVIRAIRTGRRCTRRGVAWLAGPGQGGWTETVIAPQLGEAGRGALVQARRLAGPRRASTSALTAASSTRAKIRSCAAALIPSR